MRTEAGEDEAPVRGGAEEEGAGQRLPLLRLLRTQAPPAGIKHSQPQVGDDGHDDDEDDEDVDDHDHDDDDEDVDDDDDDDDNVDDTDDANDDDNYDEGYVDDDDKDDASGLARSSQSAQWV